jgi:hypothetical protein
LQPLFIYEHHISESAHPICGAKNMNVLMFS